MFCNLLTVKWVCVKSPRNSYSIFFIKNWIYILPNNFAEVDVNNLLNYLSLFLCCCRFHPKYLYFGKFIQGFKGSSVYYVICQGGWGNIF